MSEGRAPVASGPDPLRWTVRMPLAMGQAAVLVAWALGSVHWVLDLANHGVVLWIWLALLGLLASWRHPRWAVAFSVALVLHSVRWTAPSRGPGRKGQDLRHHRLLLANVYTGNPDRQRLLGLVAVEAPDLVGLLEVDERWIGDLGALRASHPHHLELPRRDNFGIALYSTEPLDTVRRVDLGPAGVPSIEAVVDGLPVLLTHPVPPIGAEYTALRDAQLAEVEAWMTHHGEGWVVAGDLNTTPWAATFPGHHRGWPQGTFPAGLPGIARIPIDHVLAGPAVVGVDRRVGPHIGSDHRPVIADISF